MACVNSKSIKNAIKTFFKENARDPELNEFRKLVSGNSERKKKQENEETEKQGS